MQMLNKVLGWSVASVVLAWAAVDRVCRCKSRTIECERHRREAVANELLSKKISNKNRTCVPTGSRRSRNRRARCWLLLFWFRYSLYATHATAAASVFYRSRTTCMRLFGATKAWRAKTWQWSEWRANPIFFFFLFHEWTSQKKKRKNYCGIFVCMRLRGLCLTRLDNISCKFVKFDNFLPMYSWRIQCNRRTDRRSWAAAKRLIWMNRFVLSLWSWSISEPWRFC